MEINELDKLVDALPVINPNQQFESNNQLKTDQYLMQLLWNVKVHLIQNKNHFHKLAKHLEYNYAQRLESEVKMDQLTNKTDDIWFKTEEETVSVECKSQQEKLIKQPTSILSRKIHSQRFKLPMSMIKEKDSNIYNPFEIENEFNNDIEQIFKSLPKVKKI